MPWTENSIVRKLGSATCNLPIPENGPGLATRILQTKARVSPGAIIAMSCSELKQMFGVHPNAAPTIRAGRLDEFEIWNVTSDSPRGN